MGHNIIWLGETQYFLVRGHTQYVSVREGDTTRFGQGETSLFSQGRGDTKFFCNSCFTFKFVKFMIFGKKIRLRHTFSLHITFNLKPFENTFSAIVQGKFKKYLFDPSLRKFLATALPPILMHAPLEFQGSTGKYDFSFKFVKIGKKFSPAARLALFF